MDKEAASWLVWRQEFHEGDALTAEWGFRRPMDWHPIELIYIPKALNTQAWTEIRFEQLICFLHKVSKSVAPNGVTVIPPGYDILEWGRAGCLLGRAPRQPIRIDCLDGSLSTDHIQPHWQTLSFCRRSSCQTSIKAVGSNQAVPIFKKSSNPTAALGPRSPRPILPH